MPSDNTSNQPPNLLTTVLEKTLDPVAVSSGGSHQTRPLVSNDQDAQSSSASASASGTSSSPPSHNPPSEGMGDIPLPSPAVTGVSTPVPHGTTSTTSKPAYRRFASAVGNKPLQLAGSLKRGLTGRGGSGSTTNLAVSGGAGAVSSGSGEEDLEPIPMRSTGKNGGHSSTSHPPASSATDPSRLKSYLEPLPSEKPIAILRVRVIRATSLVSRDRNGLSDPFLTLSLPPTPVQQTPPMKKTLNPSWEGEKERDKSTFDFPLYESLGNNGVYEGRGVEVVVWDRDFGGVRKDYMGEVSVRLGEWGTGGLVWKESIEPTAYNLHSSRRPRRKSVSISGTVHLQVGLVLPAGEIPKGLTEEWASEVFLQLRKKRSDEDDALNRLKESVLAVPAYQGVGTVKIRTKRRKRHIPKNAMKSAARTLFHRRSRKPGAKDDTGAATLSDQDSGMSEDGEDTSGSEDDEDEEDALRDDGLSDSPSEVEDDGDVYSMGFLVPDRSRRDTSSTWSSVTMDRDRQGSMTGSQSAAPMRGQTIDEHHSAHFSTSSERELSPRIKTNGFEAPAIIEVPPSATKDTPPGYFDKVISRRRTSRDHIGAQSGIAASLSSPASGLLTPSPSVPEGGKLKKRLRKVRRKDTAGTEYNFGVGRDILGIVMLEISGAKDLPKLRNSLRFTFDMDPFVVISFGKKVFRTRVIRHELNPTWDEKMLFHVRRYEDHYDIQFSLLDWDKVSGNDFIGTSSIPLQELISDAPGPDPKTGLYGPREDGKHDMKEFALPIATAKELGWENRHAPVLNVRAKYEPYDALRQRFWRQYLLQFDSDNTGTISFTELTTMLDSLNSTLTNSTLESYFIRFDKDPEEGELTFDELIRCLEDEIKKSASEKKHIRSEPGSGTTSPSMYPAMAPYPASEGLDQSGPSARPPAGVDAQELADHIKASRPHSDNPDSPNGDINVKPVKIESSDGPNGGQHLTVNEALSSSSTPDVSESESDIGERVKTERIINIKSCPLCHRPRLKKKSEADILTHLAVCASADWERVDRIVVGNYVTASQAQRKFFTKVLTKVSAGAYSLGANSANIIVQDRLTGQLQEEKMAVYVRIGIRVLYKGAKKGMAGNRARKLLKSMSVKQGLKYNSPESKADIPTFVAYHKLNTDEIRDPLESYQTFNEFFYRRLKAEARPITSPENPSVLVSCADCRMMAFETVSEATRLWIKGKEFSVGRLLGDNYKNDFHKYEGGALGIFRLAPQDYHRYHSPVDGVVGKPTRIEGQYYTVNPQAIRTTLDVYGENVREVWPIHSPQFGTVMTVWIGAMMVGSIGATVKEGDTVKRGDELGWFAFGGSTIVCLFERGKLRWDEDILDNSSQAIETLVRMGMGIGRVPDEN